MATGKPLGFRGRVQDIMDGSQPMGIVEARVTGVDPLEVTNVSDDKHVINENLLVVPAHLTDYETTVTIDLDSGTINARTQTGQGTHGHGPSGGHAQYSGDGTHSHPITEGAHVHDMQTFELQKAKMTVHNALELGEIVYLLSYNHGQRYFILDRGEATE